MTRDEFNQMLADIDRQYGVSERRREWCDTMPKPEEPSPSERDAI